MTKWIVFFALIVSGSILGYMFYSLQQNSIEAEGPAPSVSIGAIRIVDGFKDGIHRLSGTVKLPHSCYSVKTDSIVDANDASKVILTLTSRDNMLDQSVCAKIRTRYPFETIIEAQKDITIRLVLDGAEFPVVVAQTDWQNPSGSIINTDKPL